jgi:phage-related protein
MGTVLPLASASGLSFAQVAGGLATMTNSGLTAQHAAQNLAFAIRGLEAPNGQAVKAMQAVGLSAQQLKNTLSQQGLSGAIQLIEEHVGKKFPAGSVDAVEAFKHIMGGAVGYNVALMLGGQHMKAYEANIASIGAALGKNASDVEGFDLVQKNLNFQWDKARMAVDALLIKIGIGLLPVVSQLLAAVTPLIGRFSDWVTKSNILSSALSLLAVPFRVIRQVIGEMLPPLQELGQAIEQAFGLAQPVIGPFADALDRGSIAVKVSTQAFHPFLDALDRGSIAVKQVAAAISPFADAVDRGSIAVKGSVTAFQPFLDAADRGSIAVKNITTSLHSSTQAVNPFLAAIKALTDVVRTVGPSVAEVVTTLVRFGQQAIPTVRSAVESLSPTFTQVAQIISGQFIKNIQFAVQEGQQISQWIKSSLLPAILEARPGFLNLGQTILETVLPALLHIWAAGQQLLRTVLAALIPVLEHLIPLLIVLEGAIANGVAQALKFLLPYVVQAAQAILQFAGDIATRVAPILIQLFDTAMIGFKTFLVVWNAVWPSLAPILKGVWDIIVGVIKTAWALVSGIILVGLDLLSGNWGQAWQDIQKMLKGVWDGIQQIMHGSTAALWGIITSLINGIIALFVGLYHALVGGSIVPDMVNAIVQWFAGLPGRVLSAVLSLLGDLGNFFSTLAATSIQQVTNLINEIVQWFAQLPGRALSAVASLAGSLAGFFSGLASQAYSWGANISSGLVNGINSARGAVGTAASNVAATVKNFLGFHSPTKEGPGRDADTWGPALVKTFTQGVQQNLPALQASFNLLAAPAGVASPGTRAPIGGGHTYNFTVNVTAPARSGKESQDIADTVMQVISQKFLRSGVVLPTFKGV